MASSAEARVSGSGRESSGRKAGTGCPHFGVRSHLHHFYGECSSSVWNRGDQEVQADREDQGVVRNRALAIWKVSLTLGLLILTAGVASLSAGYSTPPKIESFGEGDMFFVDSRAVVFNRGIHVTTAAGIGLSCLGSALAAMGVVVWILPRGNSRGEAATEPGGFPPLSVAENVQPAP